MSKFKKPVQISIPQSQDLGFCTVNQTSQFPFTIFNPNQIPLPYNFKFTKFTILPSKGVLMPNSITNFKIQFIPSQAAVIVGTIILQVQGEDVRTFKLSAVGKYPYISTNYNQIDFGETLVTKSASKQLVLKNSSQVAANFQLMSQQQNNEFQDNFFYFQPKIGTIPPKLTYSVKVNYNPLFSDFNNINKFKMICQNGNQLSLICKGHSNKFSVFMQQNSLNFKSIKLNLTTNKVLTLINNSELSTEFQFYTDSNNIFSFSQRKGTLSKNSYKKIVVQFRPQNTIAYYERVYCLVRNHNLLYVDLIGTCQDLLIKPLPLLQQHVDIFRKRVIQGRISEIQLKYIENNMLLKLSKKVQYNEDSPGVSQQNFYSQLHNNITEHPYVLHKQLFLEGSKNQLISVNEDQLQFGFCEVMTMSGQRQIQITNKMQTTLTLYWIPQKRENLNGQYMKVFNIFPESATIKPKVPVKFQVTFRPLKSNNYYFQYLQFYAIKSNDKVSKITVEQFQKKQLKSKPQTTLLRNIKLSQTIQAKVKQDIQTTQLFPSLSGVIRCVGHSFAPTSLPFIPIMKIFPNKKVTFKPCLKYFSVYETVQLINTSDTPIFYKISQDINKVFRVFPRIGLIQPKSFSIVTLEFSPKQYKTYNSNLSIYLNDMQAGSPKLNLIGICTPPQLKFQNQGKIYFAPTFTGVYTKKQFLIENVTKTPVTYKIQVPQKYKQELYFEPLQKTLQPNQPFKVNVYFTPSAKRTYKIKVPIKAYQSDHEHNLGIGYHNPGSGKINESQQIKKETQTRQFQIQVFGQGADGSIKLSEQQINFNVVKISEQKKITVSLKNSSDCAFYVELSLKNQNFEAENPPTDNQINSSFNIDFRQGVIPGNSQIKINITFNPIQVLNFDLKLIVNAKQKAPKKISTMTLKGTDPCMKCQMKVKAQGNFPLLQIIDIRNDTLSVAALWQNFQIQKINHELQCNLTNSQKQYLGLENLTFNQIKTLQTQLKNYQWNLGYVSAKTKAKPRKVIITVRNIGGTPLNYTFKFPSDNKIQEQLWADPGEPTLQEAYEKAILDKKIFQIRPKTGQLAPNQVKDIQLIYSPTTLQQHKTGGNNQVHMLRVVFQIANGKSLVFNLKGTTLGPNEGLLTVKKIHYQLPQTPIGLLTPLRFPIQMNNVGSIKVTYKSQIQYEDDQFSQVFRIQNPNHFILPGQNYYLYCLYKPLIMKVYNFKIEISVMDFSKQIQNFELTIVGNPLKTIRKSIEGGIVKNVLGQRNTVSQFGSKVFFSIQQIDYGIMEPCQTKYRMIILYNMSKQYSLNYDFPSQTAVNMAKLGLTCGDKFSIQPANGLLEPESFIQLKLTLTSTKNPSIYQGQIGCNITWSQAKYTMNQGDITQKDTALVSKKQTLFLRLKKCSAFNLKQLDKRKDRNFNIVEIEKKSIIDTIFDNIIGSSLNEQSLLDEIQKLSNEKSCIIDMIESEDPVSISNLIKDDEVNENIDQKRDFSNHQLLFLNQEFTDIAELIMENTFFNIVQQTTHKQNDFLRVSKKFIQADKV